jgi:DUF1680 family protein
MIDQWKKSDAVVEKGYLKLNRAWKKGDVVELALDMPVRKVMSNENVKTNQGKVAIERGPVLYCAEGHDNGGKALSIKIRVPSHLFRSFRKTCSAVSMC